MSDRGGGNCNEISRIVAEKPGMSGRFTRPYHPQANGVCERNVGVIANRIARTIKTGPSDWVRLLPAALTAMRAAENASTGYVPFAFLSCRDFLTPIHVELNGAPEIQVGELIRQGAEEDSGRKETANKATEVAQFVANYKRIGNPKLLFFLARRIGGRIQGNNGRGATRRGQAEGEQIRRSRIR